MRARPLLATLFALAAICASHGVSAEPIAKPAKRPRVVLHERGADHPAARYGSLGKKACFKELGKRAIAFEEAAGMPSIAAPVRLTKDVGGVLYRTEMPAHARAASPFEVMDCRLVLALSDMSTILAAHGVAEVVLLSAYRPVNVRGGERPSINPRHPGGLAIDVARFIKKPGEPSLDVLRDFHGAVGAPACGPGAAKPSPDTPEARALRAITCAAASRHLFTVILTPNYNRAHQNHLHLEVTPGAEWSLVR